MHTKETKAEAVRLRRSGLSYNEILEKVPVAKSTLSLWLRDVPLTKSQQKRLRLKHQMSNEGGIAENKPAAIGNSNFYRKRRQRRFEAAQRKFRGLSLNKRSLALVGAALYWAEGCKRGTELRFTNSDSDMIRLFLIWVRDILGVVEEDLSCCVSKVHLNNGKSYSEVEYYWSEVTGIPRTQFTKPTIAAPKKTSNRRNILVYGIIRISVLRSMPYRAMYEVLVEKLGKSSSFVDRSYVGGDGHVA